MCFKIKDTELIVEPFSVRTFRIYYFPSELGEVQECLVKFYND